LTERARIPDRRQSESDAEKALRLAARTVALAPKGERLDALKAAANSLRPHVAKSQISPAKAIDRIFEIAMCHGLAGKAGSEEEAAVGEIARLVKLPEKLIEPEPEAPRRSYSTPQSTIDAFWYVVRNECPEYLKGWLARHPADAPFLLTICKQKNARETAVA
jgi:hypothetical protein